LAEDADQEAVDVVFASLLGLMAARRRVVLLVDGLDQFETTLRGRYVSWLPWPWPTNARLIATAIPGEGSEALLNRTGVALAPLPPLHAAEARGIIKGICDRYHRTFEPEVIDALLAKTGPEGPAWGNPLWLVLAIEDLNLLEADDFDRAQRAYTGEPAERLRALMVDIIARLPGDIPGLYGHTFERAEELFGRSVVRGFLALIAVSRTGWRESDFRILLPRVSGENWDVLQFAQLRRYFRGQMRRRSAMGFQSRADARGCPCSTAVAGDFRTSSSRDHCRSSALMPNGRPTASQRNDGSSPCKQGLRARGSLLWWFIAQ
jgi:hypothetical protein